MKSRILLGKVLIGVGLLVLVTLAALHLYAASRGNLKPFDEDGERVFVPFMGTVCLGTGLFLLALSGGSRNP